MNENYFIKLNSINVNENKKKKKDLDYLSWAWAWAEVKKMYPSTTSKVYEREDGRIYWDDGKTAWVKVGVTVENIEHIEYLPIMDFSCKSMKVENITSMEVNKAIQRGLTKAIARHGIGLYIYAGEDLPEDEEDETVDKNAELKTEPKKNEHITDEQKETLKSLGTNINGLLQHFKLKSIDDMTKETADKAIEQRKKFIAEAKKAEEDKKVVL